MTQFKDITLHKIYEARRRINSLIQYTPLVPSAYLSSKWERNVSLKLENLQPTGAFKLRGAANAILSLSPAEQKRGVITVSTGNHGKAIAYVAKKLGIKATIYISDLVPDVKVNAMKALGAEVTVVGKDQDEATQEALLVADKQGLRYISAFDDPDVIAGQGTTALEILEQSPNLDTLVAPVSGGGLMGGIAFVIKSIAPHIRIIGVTNDQEPAIYNSVRAGHIVQVGEAETLADALSGPISEDNQYTFEMCRQFVDEFTLVSEEQIAQAMVYALHTEKQVLEGGAAVTLALLLSDKTHQLGQNIVGVCTGNSVSMTKLLKLASEYQL
ncbi:hypothetical protein BKI52_09665 [marine bacterium AO1-C]|nr:hypothetical protein BKI52_09665 [marine bacterium AO1-C]